MAISPSEPPSAAAASLLRPRLLLVDRDVAEAGRISRYFEGEGFEVLVARTTEQAVNALERQAFDGLVTELEGPGIDGLLLLRAARRLDPEAMVVLLGEPDLMAKGARAILDGAWDFQTRPLVLEKILAGLRRTERLRRLIGEVRDLNRRLDKKYGLRNIIGASPAISLALDRILQAGPTEATVLITGETGTGKELVATALHQASTRRSGPLIRLHCADLSEGLVDSELFGHEKGAFTGAVAARKGRFELADGGTIFLDEVGELAAGTQVRLLRVLQEREFIPVGGEAPVRVDVRVVAATHHDLRALVAAGRFREDLYYRLNVVSIEMPALRHRPQDIPLLVEHFLSEAAETYGHRVPGVTHRAMARLARYHWPGNVRELKNVIVGTVIQAPGDRPIDLEDLPPLFRSLPDEERLLQVPLGTSLAEVEQRLIEAHLREHGKDIRGAARALGVSVRTLYRRLDAYQKGTDGGATPR